MTKKENECYNIGKNLGCPYGCPGFLAYISPYPNYVPAGVDFNAAKELGKKVIWALSLPGKTAPISSGKIIKDTILNILKEQGV